MKKKAPAGRKTPKGEPHGHRVLEIPQTGQTPKGQAVGTDVATRFEPYMLAYTGKRRKK